MSDLVNDLFAESRNDSTIQLFGGLPALAVGCLFTLIGLSGASGETVYMPTRQNLAMSVRPTAPLEGPTGITAISGEIVDVNGAALAGVTVGEGSAKTRTGADGKFLLLYAIPGKGVLQIDGRYVGPHGLDYGFYQVAIEVARGVTNVLPFKDVLSLIDHSHDVSFPSPTTGPVVVSNPALPGVEIHIPAGVVVRDADGKVVTSLGLTGFPSDKAPVPMLQNFRQSKQFTIQPGASCLYDAKGGIGTAQVILSNEAHQLPKARVGFYRYEPDRGGWGPYGFGSVSADGVSVVPDPDTVLTDFASAECDPATKSRPAPAARISVVFPRPKP